MQHDIVYRIIDYGEVLILWSYSSTSVLREKSVSSTIIMPAPTSEMNAQPCKVNVQTRNNRLSLFCRHKRTYQPPHKPCLNMDFLNKSEVQYLKHCTRLLKL